VAYATFKREYLNQQRKEQPMTTSATLSGNIIIGSTTDPTKQIKVPLSTDLPPKTSGDFSFKYGPKPPADSANIVLADFISWATGAVGISFKSTDLPTSLQTLSIALTELDLNTNGNITVATSLGSVQAGKWNDQWTPITGVGIALDSVALKVTRTP
jgi:hypothetical protein